MQPSDLPAPAPECGVSGLCSSAHLSFLPSHSLALAVSPRQPSLASRPPSVCPTVDSGMRRQNQVQPLTLSSCAGLQQPRAGQVGSQGLPALERHGADVAACVAELSPQGQRDGAAHTGTCRGDPCEDKEGQVSGRRTVEGHWPHFQAPPAACSLTPSHSVSGQLWEKSLDAGG